MRPRDSYIVRVYRREGSENGGIVGIVNNVSTEESRAFKTVDELWAALNEAGIAASSPIVKEGRGSRRSNDQTGPKAGGR